MIVYIYELRSQSVHGYQTPSERSPYNTTVFTSQGYFVYQPDIVYRDRNPGLSAVECVVPAVEEVIKTGMIDRDRIGLVGHSWGAYQTSFIVTQTDLFASAVAGAPLTDLISMYLSIYWNSGGTDARIFEISQGRMEVPPWEDLESYMANSALFNITDMNTPLLVAFGDQDGAVDWHQGIELYNAARRAEKPYVMLVYPDENHSLRNKWNQLDYHRRIIDWFGHYLQGTEAPEWMTDGVERAGKGGGGPPGGR
jgi:dipeptidyl aminopeptidase/acylaminoacyl peptidase